MFREKINRFHFVGIGGIGMSGIAQILIDMGYEVSGSDIKENKNTTFLRQRGAKVHIGHKRENVEKAQVVVYSSAVSQDNVEIKRAKELGIPIISRGDMLAELFRVKEGIAVSGSHGKTTTTSMLAHILHDLGYDPTVIIGGILKKFGSNARLGDSELMLSEADESDGSFLKLSPVVAVATNVDREHLDFYGSFEKVKEAFREFLSKVPFYGFAVLNLDDDNLSGLLPHLDKRVITYAIKEDATVKAKDLSIKDGTYSFSLIYEGKNMGRVHLGIPGRHNVYNALAAVSVALQISDDFKKITNSLREFTNAERRLDFKGFVESVPVYDDYGHHPTEIRAVVEAVRELHPEREVFLVLQPHRYSRTYLLFEDFVKVLSGVSKKIITDIYPAGEENTYGVSARELSERSGAMYAPSKDKVFELINRNLGEDVLLFMGAGDISKWCSEFVSTYSNTSSSSVPRYSPL